MKRKKESPKKDEKKKGEKDEKKKGERDEKVIQFIGYGDLLKMEEGKIPDPGDFEERTRVYISFKIEESKYSDAVILFVKEKDISDLIIIPKNIYISNLKAQKKEVSDEEMEETIKKVEKSTTIKILQLKKDGKMKSVTVSPWFGNLLRL